MHLGEWRGNLAENLSHNDLKRLRNAMRSVGTPAFLGHFKRLLRAKLRFDTFLVLRFDRDARPVVQGVWLQPSKIPYAAVAEYRDQTYLFDPFFRYSAFPPEGAVYQLSDIAPDRFFSSEYYLEYYRDTGLCDEVGLLVPLPNDAVAHLSLSRLETSGPFRRREIQCLRHHAPVLLELLSQHCTLMQTQEGQGVRKTRFTPLSEIIFEQTKDMLTVPLTRREAQIAALVLMGHSNGSAALRLNISGGTSKVHRRNLYRKLSISSQGELFALLKHFL